MLQNTVTEHKFHESRSELSIQLEWRFAGIIKRIKRLTAEMIKTLYDGSHGDSKSIAGWYSWTLDDWLWNWSQKRLKWTNTDIEHFFVEDGYWRSDELVERPASCHHHGTATVKNYPLDTLYVRGNRWEESPNIGAYQIVENGKKITFLDTPWTTRPLLLCGRSVVHLLRILPSWSAAWMTGVMPQGLQY